MTTPAQPLKRGRPKNDTNTAAKLVRVYTSLTPAEREWLTGTYGTVWSGLQSLVREKLSAKKPTK